MALKCERCGNHVVVLETFCTDPYSNGIEWFRDIKKRCVCENCGKELEITVDTVKQDKWFK
jgi:catechol-2,3-dioxygenase